MDISINNLTFGEHAFPTSMGKLEAKARLHRVAKVSCITAVAVTSVLAVLSGAAVISVAVAVSVGAFLVLTTFTSMCITGVQKHTTALRSVGILNRSDSPLSLPKFKPHERANALYLKDGMEVHRLRLKAIEKANHSILVSGNFCGGKSLEDVCLAYLERRKVVPDLKMVLLTSSSFLTKDNKAQFKEMQRSCGGDFEVIVTDNFFNTGGIKFQLASNHAKAFVVDGHLCINAGIGIQDQYTYCMHDPKFKARTPRSMLSSVVADRFLDSGLAFTSTGKGPALSEYYSLLGLLYRWRHLEHYKRHGTEAPHGVVEALIQSPLPELPRIELETLEPPRTIRRETSMQMHTSSPDLKTNTFYQALEEKIRGARRRIIFGHLYVQFDKRMRQLLAQKMREGVEVVVITNGARSGVSPCGHRLFVPRHDHCLNKLLKEAGDAKDRLRIYQVTQKMTTYHTKAIVIDDTLLCGSSNIGWKSQNMSDYENNLIVTSRDLADDAASALLEHATDEYHLPDGPSQNCIKRVINKVYKKCLRFFIG